MQNGNCVGGAEFVPSEEVPYAIPKSKDTAFLTCSFLSSAKLDFRSYPLNILENELTKLKYKALEAVVSREVMFPNGTLKWFENRGYEDFGIIYTEKQDNAEMHLLSKKF